MKKIVLTMSALLIAVSVAGCDYLDSPERKAFKEFVAKCKKDPSTADCKAWEDSKNSPGGN